MRCGSYIYRAARSYNCTSLNNLLIKPRLENSRSDDRGDDDAHAQFDNSIEHDQQLIFTVDWMLLVLPCLEERKRTQGTDLIGSHSTATFPIETNQPNVFKEMRFY